MGKCVVSGCPNRNVSRGVFSRAPKRFFSFPNDPARVKVWLAALRETDKLDSLEEHLICEDHFLPEDISSSGVSSEAIPIMPPYLDLQLGNPWGADTSEEEQEEEQEQESWAPGGQYQDEGVFAPLEEEPPSTQQDPAEVLQNPPADPSTRTNDEQTSRTHQPGLSMALLTRRFLQLMMAAPGGRLDLRQAAASMQTPSKRLAWLCNTLEGLGLLQRASRSASWIGSIPISSFLQNRAKFQMELQNLKLVEDTLDILIKSCAQQLYDMTDDQENSRLAYLTSEDVGRLEAFQEQMVITIKAPEETKLEVPPPTEDHIQICLKSDRGAIAVATHDVGGGDPSGRFVPLEESRIRTTRITTGIREPPGGANLLQASNTPAGK